MISLEPGRQAEVALPCLPYLDSIVINELEVGVLTGIDRPMPTADGPVDWLALEAMALGLIERGVSALAVVHFPAGCVAVASAAACVRGPNTSDGIKRADACLAQADEAGYRPVPPLAI
jgi:hypothetical protein